MKSRLILIPLFALLVVSCNQTPAALDTPTLEIPVKTVANTQVQVQKPTSTVTPTISSTPTKTETTPTIAITSTPSPDILVDNRCPNEQYLESLGNQDGFTGNIYIWDPYPMSYYVLNPGIGLMSLFELKPFDPNVPGPGEGFALAFSTYSQKLAYLATNSSGIVELWVADPDLCDAERIWEDTEQWLGDASTKRWQTEVSQTWGPSDKSLVTVSWVNRPHIFVYSFTDRELHTWSGECNQLIRNPNSGQWEMICAIVSEGVASYGLLGADGSIHLLSSLPEGNLITAIDWAFSPDQRQVIFAAQDYSIFIGNSEGVLTQLPIYWDEESVASFDRENQSREFQWTMDSAHILAYGYEAGGAKCPKRVSMVVAGEKFEQPCWFLLDAQSGEIVWWLKEEVVQQEARWEGLYMSYEAALSPDEKWVAMFFMDAPIRYAVLVSLETDEVVVLGNFVNTKIFWGEE